MAISSSVRLQSRMPTSFSNSCGLTTPLTVTDSIEKKLTGMGVKEISSSWIGEEVMNSLRETDKVAYVRFASVYRQFKDINELLDEVKNLFEHQDS